jgi:hypothetical protein
MSIETADILDEAANVIERNGHHKGDYYTDEGGRAPAACPVCTYGAIHVAAFGEPVPTLDTIDADGDAATEAIRSLRRHLNTTALGAWNDAPDRTAEQVITTLRSAAQAEREAAS